MAYEQWVASEELVHIFDEMSRLTTARGGSTRVRNFCRGERIASVKELKAKIPIMLAQPNIGVKTVRLLRRVIDPDGIREEEEMAKPPMNILFTKAQMAFLAKEAEILGLSIADAVRRIVDERRLKP